MHRRDDSEPDTEAQYCTGILQPHSHPHTGPSSLDRTMRTHVFCGITRAVHFRLMGEQSPCVVPLWRFGYKRWGCVTTVAATNCGCRCLYVYRDCIHLLQDNAWVRTGDLGLVFLACSSAAAVKTGSQKKTGLKTYSEIWY
jgi:hypothetical protein